MKNLLMGLIIIFTFSDCNFSIEKSKSKNVIIEIDFNKAKTSKAESISWKEGLTALEALQFASNVKTHPVGEYVFVSAIDNVHGIRGEKAWYYKINGESPVKLAINNIINPGDTITWIYKEDVCSKTVDGCKEKK